MNNEGIGDICGTVEEALHAWIVANLASLTPANWVGFGGELQVYRGLENRETQDMETQDSSIRILPAIVCICQSAPAMPLNFHGGYEPEAKIQVVSNRDKTSRDTHRARTREVFNLFLTPTIAQDLSDALDNFHVEGVVIVQQSYDLKMRTWVSELTVTLKQAVCADIF